MLGQNKFARSAESPFVEINAKTGEVIRNSFSHSLFNANFKLGKWKFLNNKFYFTAAQDSISSSHIGIMDYETLELLWITKVANQKGAFRDLQVIENKIYVLDNGNQLHIYEKE